MDENREDVVWENNRETNDEENLYSLYKVETFIQIILHFMNQRNSSTSIDEIFMEENLKYKV